MVSFLMLKNVMMRIKLQMMAATNVRFLASIDAKELHQYALTVVEILDMNQLLGKAVMTVITTQVMDAQLIAKSKLMMGLLALTRKELILYAIIVEMEILKA